MKKNDTVRLTIESITNEGMGIGRAEGMAVFVPRTAPGDIVQAHIVKALSTYAYGAVEAIEQPSPHRCDPGCAVYGRCGGCALRQMTYDEELRQKARWVSDAFSRIAKLKFAPLPILPSPQAEGYRNKAQYPVGIVDGRAVTGFYAPRSHRLIPVEHCPLQPAQFTALTAAFCAWLAESGAAPYDEATGRGLIRHLYLRRGEVSGEVMACIVAASQALPQPQRLIETLRAACPQLAGVVLNINAKNTNVILGGREHILWGAGVIRDTLCGVALEISPRSFYQVNRGGAELLYGEAKRAAALTGTETLLDLYCGAGTIGLSMAGSVRRLIGVEAVPAAVEDARRNAERNGIANAEFFCADAGEAAQRLADEGVHPDVVVVDPPRRGCDAATLDAVVRMSPARVVMVSCNPATAARDCALLAQSGYALASLRPVDMFPRTAHVETVCLLVRRNGLHVNIDVDVEEMLQEKRGQATYPQLKEYVLAQTGMKVSSLYISQVKRKCGLDVSDSYNKPKSEDAHIPQCPPEKENAIMEALRHFGLIS